MENWKPVFGYEKYYSVSDLGRVRSEKRGIILRPQKRRHGYLSVWLYGDDSKTQVSVHRLVAMAFCENPNDLPEVNHKNEDKTDNRAENLEWVTHRENSVYGTCKKRSAAKQVNHPAKSRAISQFTMDGKLVKTYPSLAEARRAGFSAGNICKCAQGKSSYSHAYGFIWRYA